MRSILRQIVAVLALVGMAATMAPSTFAAPYTAQAATDKLATNGFIVNQSATPAAYRLADNLLRQEGLGVAAKIRGVLTMSIEDYQCTNRFTDVGVSTGYIADLGKGWVCRTAELSAEAGITNTANSTFRPRDNLTRYEALVFALRAADLIPAGPQTQSGLVQLGVDNGLITSVAGFNINAFANRGEFFQYVVRGLDAAETLELCEIIDACPNPGTPGTSGSVNVSLSSGQPSGLIVGGQATADIAKFTFSGNGTLNTVTLQRSGLSDQNTLSNVYLFDGNVRLTDGYSFNSQGSITMNNIGLAINGSKTLTVKADVAVGTAAGQTVIVSLTGYTVAGSSAASVVLSGNTLTTGAAGSLAGVSLGVNSVGVTSVNAGVTSYAFWSAPIQVNTRTVHLQAANFRMVGSAPADALSNIRLFINGVDSGAAANVMMVNGSNYASFDFGSTSKELPTGSHTLEVRANVVKGSNRTVQFSIQQASDLMIRDPQVGINIAVSGTVPNTAGTITINTGSLTVELDPTFNAMTNITGGGSNTTIAKFKLLAYGEDVKVQSLQILPVLAGTTPNPAVGLDDVTLYLNGSQVGTQQDWTTGNLTFQLGSQAIVAAGVDSVLEVRANIRTTTGVNYTAGTISANVVAGVGTAQGQSSLNTLNVPARIGNTLTIQTGNLSVSRNTAYANASVSPNTSNVKIGSFVLQNQSTSESVRVTNFSVALAVGVGTTLTNFSSLRTSETSGSGANPVQPQATNTFSVDFTLAPGATRTIDIFATSGSDVAANTTIIPTLTVTSIGATSNVSATSAAIVGQTVSFGTATITNPPVFIANASTNAQFVASGTVGSGQLVDGSKNVFRLLSTGGTATVSELKFSVTSSASTASTDTDANTIGAQTLTVAATAGIVAGDIVQLVGATGHGRASVTTITDGTTMVVNVLVASAGLPSAVRVLSSSVSSVRVGNVSAPVVNGVAYLTGLSLVVPQGGSGLSIEVYPTYNNVGINGLVSGTTSIASLTEVKFSSGGTTATITPSVSSNTITLTATRPTVTVAKPDGSIVSIGNVKAIEVTVAADAKGDLTLNSLPITVGVGGADTTVNTAGLNTVIVTKSDNSTIGTTSTAFVGGVATKSGTSTISFTGGGYLIPAGTSQKFLIYVPVTAVTGGVGDSSLSTSLATGAGFSWSDTAGTGVTFTGTTLVFGYPNTFTSTLNN